MATKIKYFKLNSDELEMKIKNLTNKDFFSIESKDYVKEQLDSSIRNLESLNITDELENLYTNVEIVNTGWNSMNNSKGSRIDDSFFNDTELDPKQVMVRLKNCIDLEQLYLTKHNEILYLFNSYINMMKFLTNLITTIVVILNSLREHECESNLRKIRAKKRKIQNIQSGILKQLNNTETIENSNILVKELEKELLDFSDKSGGKYGGKYRSKSGKNMEVVSLVLISVL